MTSRRLFMKSGAMTMLSLGFAPAFLTRTAQAADARRRLLIAIFQRGAVDGLNMIVPFGESEYYKLRPTIALARPGATNGVLDLDGFFGMHPRMSALKPFWSEGALAVVHACGSHDTTRSHFDAQDYMETATPGVKNTRDGWLNRYLQSTGQPVSLRGVALAKQMPRALQGKAPALAFEGVAAFDVGGAGGDRARGRGAARDARGGAPMPDASTMERKYAEAADSLLSASAREAFDAMRIVRNATGGYQQAAGVEYPRSPFGQAMQEIARLAKADVGLEIAFAESTNWDHHVNEGGNDGQLAARLQDLSNGLAALARDLGERLTDTVMLTMSEFGRTASENGNRGTDHGHGNAMMLIGGPVKGGRAYGRWPGLRREQRFEGRDLAITTDFRDVFSEVVTRHLGAGADAVQRIFPGHKPGPALGVIRT
jgi:uncharacterized protein (DUF1501 family)